MTPVYHITVDQTALTEHVQRFLTRLQITDKSGVEADELTLEFTDPGQVIALPRRGVWMQVSLGWKKDGQTGPLFHKGAFCVDEVSVSGPPDRITIKARSADFQNRLKEQREQSWDKKTIADILGTIAQRHNLIPAISDSLAATMIEHIDQTGESDLHFLTRLGKDFDATASVKEGRLLFLPQGWGQKTDGTPLKSATINSHECSRFRATLADRAATFTGVKARWRDKRANSVRFAIVGKGPTWHTLNREYSDESSAEHAAKAEMKRRDRSKSELSFTLPLGRPDIIAGQPLHLRNGRPELAQRTWIAETVTHSLDPSSGYSTAITANEKDTGDAKA